MDHEFTLILAGPLKIDRQTEDALFEAGCDDALLGSRDGVVFLDFARTADSFSEAVSTAIRDVRTAGFDVLRVEPDDLVSASEIARRTKRTRQSIRQLSTGVRGPGGFPPPYAQLKSASPLWRWTDIAKWFSDHSIGSQTRAAANSFEQAETIGRVNAVLEAQRLIEWTAPGARRLAIFTPRNGRPQENDGGCEQTARVTSGRWPEARSNLAAL